MPGHVRAADAPEDLWRCHQCGWTYPNHHPSAKHRRHHKMQCGKMPGFMKETDLKLGPQVAGSSSDDGSSDEDHHLLSSQGHKNNGDHCQEASESTPNDVVAESEAELVCSDKTDPTPNDGGAEATSKKSDEIVVATKSFDLPASKVHVTGPPQVSGEGQRSFGSAQAVKGQWGCRHCGWLYPNAHPSAKSRRKHKKICGVVPEHSIAGGSSDEASSSDEEKHRGDVSTGSAQTQELLECNPSAPHESLDAEANSKGSAKDLQVHREQPIGTEHEGTEDPQALPLESESSDPQLPKEASSVQDVFESKGQEEPDVGGTHVPGVDEERIQSTEELQPLEVVTEQVENRKADLSYPVEQNVALANGHKSINDEKKEESSSSQSFLHSAIVSPQLDVKNPLLMGRKDVSVGGESPCSSEPRTPPESPEGLVRSRVQIFEKLAASTPPYASPKKTFVSPTTNSSSPVTPRSYNFLSNGRHAGTHPTSATASECNGSHAEFHETSSHQQSDGGRVHSALKQDGPSELREVMSHLLHRGNFVQNEYNQVPVAST